MIEVVSATRASKDHFWSRTALGQSLRRLGQDPRLSSFIAFDNRRGLSEVYNARIESPKSGAVLAFMHDDVWIDDYFFSDRLLEGLERFDVVGIAGNRRRIAGQVGWPFIDERGTFDAAENLSGRVAHGPHPFGEVHDYGASRQPCELLDGMFIAARKERLRASGVGFDERFDFHFYDLDFCRQARARGLTLGTWPICLTHCSRGAFGTPAWSERLRRYREKWGD